MNDDPDPPWSGAKRASPVDPEPSGDEALASLRRRIDSIDEEILALLNRRAEAALEVAGIKSGFPGSPRYYRPEREAQLLGRLAARQKRDGGALPPAEVIRLFREVASSCRSLEQRLAVAWATAPAMRAALAHFGGAIDLPRFDGEEEALRASAQGECDYAMIAFVHAGCANPRLGSASLRGQTLIGQWTDDATGDSFVVAGREAVPAAALACSVWLIRAEHKQGLEEFLRDRSPPLAADFHPLRNPQGTKPLSPGVERWIVCIAHRGEDPLDDWRRALRLRDRRRDSAANDASDPASDTAPDSDRTSAGDESDESPILLGSFPIVEPFVEP